MSDPNLIPNALLPRELATFCPAAPAQPYRKLYGMILDGRLPAVQVNGRWFIRREDLPVIAETLGLVSAPARSPKVRSVQRAPGTSPQAGDAHRILAEAAA